jgi:ketosteroid isomerase-like protein
MPDARTTFAAVDALDVEALAALFAEDGRLVFGNREPLVGREAMIAGNKAFFELVRGLRHRLLNEWTVGADTIAETDVTYTRLDGKEVTVPAVSIWRVDGEGLIVDYRIFVDQAPLFAP